MTLQVGGAKPAIGVDMEGQGLTEALIAALAAIQEEAVGTAVGNRATVIGGELTVSLGEPIYSGEVEQETDGTITLKLVLIP